MASTRVLSPLFSDPFLQGSSARIGMVGVQQCNVHTPNLLVGKANTARNTVMVSTCTLNSYIESLITVIKNDFLISFKLRVAVFKFWKFYSGFVVFENYQPKHHSVRCNLYLLAFGMVLPCFSK